MKTSKIRVLLKTLVAIACIGNTVSAAKIAENSNWAGHFDMQLFKESAAFDALTSIEKPGKGNKIKAFLSSKFNFNAREDLRSVTAYGNGKPHNGVFVARGIFDVDKVESTLSLNKNYKKLTSDGTTYHSYIDTFDKKQKYLTFSDPNTIVVASNKEDLIQGVAIEKGNIPGMTIDIESQISGNTYMAGFFDLEGANYKRLRSPIIKKIKYTDFLLSTSEDGIRYSTVVEAVDQTSAQNLFSMANGWLAMASMQYPVLANMIELKVIENSLWVSTNAMNVEFLKGAFKKASCFSKCK